MTTGELPNATGVATFDHTGLDRLPEYDAARVALDELVRAVNAADFGVGQAEFLDAVRQMAASTAYADCCTCDAVTRYWFPHRADVDGSRLLGHYRCGTCGRRWTCGWDVAFPTYF